MIRILLIIVIATASFSAHAAEQINDYDVAIEVQKDGDILVTETIDVTSEGNQIRRGIFRDLPRLTEKNGANLPVRYDIKSIRRDGRREPYDVSKTGNAVRWRIGDPDVFLSNGRHVYEITYEVKNQIRYFDSYDELYWNAIGQYWAFPILEGRARITLPENANSVGASGYTGGFGERAGAYRFYRNNGEHVFETTSPLDAREGMTISVSLEKGLIDPPSAADKRADWWGLHGSLSILGFGALSLAGLLFSAWRKVGVDPVKGPIHPRYEPPSGYSPAGVHHIYNRRLSGHQALIASLMNMAVNKHIKLGAIDKKSTTITRLENTTDTGNLYPVERKLLNKILPNGGSRTIGGKTDMTFTKAYTDFTSNVTKKFGSEYFKWNFGYLALSIVLSIIVIIFAAINATAWSAYHALAIGALIILNLIFAYLLPAPTLKGQEIRSAIEGFKLYLEKAEKLHLNAAKVGEDPPPVMTVERYERFLPYAIALNVEKPWSKHFEKTLPREAEAYDPHWTSGGYRGHRSLHGFNNALVSSMSSGVSSAMPQSSSSSGSGGGGFSGGGGGGGGGGGW